MFNWIFRNRSKEREVGVRSALWDAAGVGARLSNWTPASTSFLNNVPPDVLVRRAEDLHRNNPWARLAVDCLTHNTVQAGIKPHPQIADPAMRAMVQREWARWTDQTDFNGRHDFYGFEQAVLRSVVTSGEAIVRLVLAPDQRVPLQLQLLGREVLDNSRVDSRTLNGIRYDDAGRRASYWLFQKHPATAPNMLSVEVPADQVIHIYTQDRPGQERGVPWLAPAMLPLRELQEYLEASLVKQKIAALMTAFITTQDGSNPLNGAPGQPPTLEPGAAVVLQPGQDVEIATPPPAADFEPFARQQLRAIARALGIPYELLSGDVSQVTFASGRHSLLEFRRHLESIQDHNPGAPVLPPRLAGVGTHGNDHRSATRRRRAICGCAADLPADRNAEPEGRDAEHDRAGAGRVRVAARDGGALRMGRRAVRCGNRRRQCMCRPPCIGARFRSAQDDRAGQSQQEQGG